MRLFLIEKNARVSCYGLRLKDFLDKENYMEDLLKVGVIASTHGLKGEVKVFPTTDDVKRFKVLKEVIMDTGTKKITLQIEGVKFFKQFAILKFKEINDINDVEQYKNCPLYVTRDHAVPLEEDEYFIADLIGLSIVDEEKIVLGKLTDILETGANDVYVLTTSEGKEVLLPAIKECILNIDMKAKMITIHMMKGLLD